VTVKFSNHHQDSDPTLDPTSSSKPKAVEIYDTTLRDGNQQIGVNFSLEDKLKIANRLNELGVPYIEGGWPNVTNKAEIAFFKRVKAEGLRSKIMAFTMTRKPNLRPEKDPNLNVLTKVEADAVTIFGKSWPLHIKSVLKASLEENLQMIISSVEYVRSQGYPVLFDAEHFFDGFKTNPKYAVKTLKAAAGAGAEALILCDTRGGSLPTDISEIMRSVRKEVGGLLGIHAHNDRGLATANSLAAVTAGARQVQGTINGLGERCGNANLVEVVGNLELSLGVKTGLNLPLLTSVSNYVYEVADVTPNECQPFVGRYAFAHKGGIHVHAVLKQPNTYESFDPRLLGNTRALAVSSQAGLASIVNKAREFGFKLDKKDPRAARTLRQVKKLEEEGYHFENAEASLNLIYAKAMGVDLNYFTLINWKALVTGAVLGVSAESTVKLKIGKRDSIVAGEGNGPVNAFDMALRKALEKQHPQISNVKLVGYRVREINVERGTAAAVRVVIDFEAEGLRWSTVGVSTNILKASEQSLTDGYIYYLYKSEVKPLKKWQRRGKK